MPLTVIPSAHDREVMHDQLDSMMAHMENGTCQGCDDCNRIKFVRELLMVPFEIKRAGETMMKGKASGC